MIAIDTDSLTRDAYHAVVLCAGDISEFLRAEMCAMSARHANEDDYLRAMRVFVADVVSDSREYLEDWGMAERFCPLRFREALAELVKEIEKVLAKPIAERGMPQDSSRSAADG